MITKQQTMKWIVIGTMAVNLSAFAERTSPFAENKTASDSYFITDLNDGRTQTILGLGKVLVGGGFLAYGSGALTQIRQAMKPLTNTAAATTLESVADDLAIGRSRLAAFDKWRGGSGKGLVRGAFLLGGTLLIVDAVGHYYEWKASAANPSLCPTYSYIRRLMLNGPKTKNAPELIKALKEIEAKRAEETPEEQKKFLDNELAANGRDLINRARERQRAREEKLAATNEGKKSNKLAVAAPPTHASKLTPKPGHPRFDDSRGLEESVELARSVQLSGDLVTGALLSNALFNRTGKQAVAAADEILRRAKAIRLPGNEAADKLMPAAQAKLRAVEMNEELARNLEELEAATEGGIPPSSSLISSEIRRIRARLTQELESFFQEFGIAESPNNKVKLSSKFALLKDVDKERLAVSPVAALEEGELTLKIVERSHNLALEIEALAQKNAIATGIPELLAAQQASESRRRNDGGAKAGRRQ